MFSVKHQESAIDTLLPRGLLVPGILTAHVLLFHALPPGMVAEKSTMPSSLAGIPGHTGNGVLNQAAEVLGRSRFPALGMCPLVSGQSGTEASFYPVLHEKWRPLSALAWGRSPAGTEC